MNVDNYAKNLNNIPVNPSIAAKVLEMVEKQDFSFSKLEEIISADPGLTTKILKIANSALYARQNRVTKLQSAITLLGINTIKNLVILITGSSLFKRNWDSPFYALFWRHSLGSAFIARDLALKTGNASCSEEAFIAGLLHNVGQIALYLHDPAMYDTLIADVLAKGLRISEKETELYGTNHKEVGYTVLSGWNFPAIYSDAARQHGDLNITSEQKQAIVLVSVASFIASNWFYYPERLKPASLIQPFLSFLGMSSTSLEAYQVEYRELIQKDKLYVECQNFVTG